MVLIPAQCTVYRYLASRCLSGSDDERHTCDFCYLCGERGFL